MRYPLLIAIALLALGCAPRLTPHQRRAVSEVRATLSGVRQDYARGRVRFFADEVENKRAGQVKLDELDAADAVLEELARE